MLHSISWDTFVEIVLLTVLSYYAISALLLFHSEIIHWLKAKVQSPVSSLSLRPEAPIKQSDILGSVNPLDTIRSTSSIDVEEIAIATVDESPELIKSHAPSQEDKQLLVGSVADLLEELKTLVQLVAEYKSTKGESREFFRALFIRYPNVQGTPFREAINLYLCEAARNQFAFDLSPEDLSSWWTVEPPTHP